MTEITVPRLSLVVLIGASGSGKSTFAARHFLGTEVVSSDTCRGLVSDDENDQSATADAFAVLHYIAGKRLAAGRIAVVDATNVQPGARKQLVELAREHDVLPVAIVLDPPESVCLERNTSRADRQFGAHVVRRQRSQLNRSRNGLRREGFRQVHVLETVEDIDAAWITRTRLYNDLRDDHGPFDVIGDVHGCRVELENLLLELGYTLCRDSEGEPVGAHHPERRVIFLGDLVDRGPDSAGVLRLVMGMVAAGDARCVSGNHENKLLRALRGRNVQRTHGLAGTMTELETAAPEFRAEVEQFIDGLISHYVLDDGNLVVSHAGLIERYHGRTSGRVREFCLYGQTTGEVDEFGLPVRYPWAEDYRGRAMVLYGHTPVPETEWVNNTLCLDTGCVFGGKLSALRYPEKDIVSVDAERIYHESKKPFPAKAERDPDVLDIADVTGKRIVHTANHGRITVRAENAAAALEVMSRFAIDPRLLWYLPPTMSPVSTSTMDGTLEHPAQAFADYRKDGVESLVCQKKHMGSRAVLLIGEESAAWTRTGRPFFSAELGAEVMSALHAAITEAGLFAEFDTTWLLLDAEILPWNLKAAGLLREQYAAVGAVARAGTSAVRSTLRAAADSGLDVTALLERSIKREHNATAFSAAYRRYCWPTEGINGIRVAPFQLLATEGKTYHDRPHSWHLDIADRLAAVAGDVVIRTDRRYVDASDPASVGAATEWWESLTANGGEGMVVKPEANLVRGKRGLAQPGLKVRGREYLRIIYGPDYTEPANLNRLRERQLGHKRSMAGREYALGIEALELLTSGAPLYRVHECVFAVLAMESEPVDPRL